MNTYAKGKLRYKLDILEGILSGTTIGITATDWIDRQRHNLKICKSYPRRFKADNEITATTLFLYMVKRRLNA